MLTKRYVSCFVFFLLKPWSQLEWTYFIIILDETNSLLNTVIIWLFHPFEKLIIFFSMVNMNLFISLYIELPWILCNRRCLFTESWVNKLCSLYKFISVLLHMYILLLRVSFQKFANRKQNLLALMYLQMKDIKQERKHTY